MASNFVSLAKTRHFQRDREREGGTEGGRERSQSWVSLYTEIDFF